MTIIKLTRRMFAISLIHNPLYPTPFTIFFGRKERKQKRKQRRKYIKYTSERNFYNKIKFIFIECVKYSSNVEPPSVSFQ